MRSARVGLASWVLAVALSISPRASAQQILPAYCFADGDCSGGAHCIEGTCRAPCTNDSNCASGQVCVAGGCFVSVSIQYPIDYGLADGNSQPGCDGPAQCTPAFTCVAGKCQNGQTCTDQMHGFDAFCTPMGGYTCGSDGKCETGSCTGDAQCNTNYPVGGLDCINGRCSSRCTQDSDCCNAGAGKKCPAGRTQNHCYLNAGDPSGGICVAAMDNGRLVVFQQANPDPRAAANNLVFIFEGITAFSGSDFSNYEHRALRHIRWLLTKASVHNAIQRNFNIFILELRDRVSGEGQPTLFGHFFGPDQLQEDLPGSEAQANYAANNALAQFAAANGVTGAAFPFPIAVVDMFPAGGGFSRAFSFHVISFPSDSGNLPDFQVPPSPATDPYYVLQHELGHFLTGQQIRDEYDNDSSAVVGRMPDQCVFNVVARSRVTGCTVCDGHDDGPFTPANATWSTFINTSTFPTTDGSLAVVGLYSGADVGFPTQAMRSQIDCVMRQDHGRTDFCPACREGLIQSNVAAGSAQTIGLLELDGHIESPVPAGDGPMRALAVSSGHKQAYLTRTSMMGPVITIIDSNLIDIRGGSTDIQLQPQLGTAGVPRAIAVDEAHQQLYLEAIDPGSPASSALLVVDANARSLLPAIDIPFMVGLPLVEPNAMGGGQVITYAEPGPTFAGQMVTYPAGSTVALPTNSVPTGGGVLPRFQRAGIRAPAAGLDFFVADERVPPDAFCSFTSCQIWAFDPATLAFRDSSAITVQTPMVVNEGIALATVVNNPNNAAPIHGELLIAVTEKQVLVWRTSDVAAGNTTPAASWPQNIGTNGLLSSVAFVAQQQAVILGNKNGKLALFAVNNGAPGPDGDAITLPAATPSMEVRDIVVSPDGATFVGLGGFAPPVGTPRNGLLAVLDLSNNMLGANRIIFQQPVDAVGLSGPTVAVDETRDVVYSNAVINSGDHIGGDPAVFRMPIMRGFRESVTPPSGCP